MNQPPVKQDEKTPPMDDVLKRMLNTPPDPKVKPKLDPKPKEKKPS